MKQPISVFWFRRDLRLEDNVGLYYSLKGAFPVMPIFIFDTEILEKLPKNDARVSFIFERLQKLRSELSSKFNSGIALFYGTPSSIFQKLTDDYEIKAVYTNHDYEPYTIQRDLGIKEFLIEKGISFKTFKDQVIFEKDDIVKNDGSPYVVYTPYMKRWKEKFNPAIDLLEYNAPQNFDKLCQDKNLPNLQLKDIGFERSSIKIPQYKVTPKLIQNYESTRNYPSKHYGTSRLGPHLRFGTVSVRKMIRMAIGEDNQIFWNELIWREFFMQILWHFPKTINTAFKPQYDRIAWRNNEEEFELWKKGNTGFALVDAGMRELNATGYMHNRVRMLVASFLCKHLLIDWRWGEAYFAKKLLDYELASNVGNWQWAAGSGVDAAPYFRIFNPLTQVEKFDKQREYINKWIPELQEHSYPPQMVGHQFARERCLKVYREAVS